MRALFFTCFGASLLLFCSTSTVPDLLRGFKLKNSSLDSDYAAPRKTRIILGYLPAVTGQYRLRQGRAISGAMSYAVDQINKNSNILPNVELAIIYNDTMGLVDLTNTILIDDLANHNVAAFIGPEGPNCEAAAELASKENRPMISFHCTDIAVPNMTKYPTFVRMDPSSSQLARQAIEVLRRQGQKDVIIVVQKYRDMRGLEQIGPELKRQVELENRADLKVAAYVEFMNWYDCYMDELPCQEASEQYNIFQIVKQNKNVSKNYVLIVDPEYLRKFIDVMRIAGLLKEQSVSMLYLTQRSYKSAMDLMDLIVPMTSTSFYNHKISSCEEIPNYEDLLQGWKLLTVITPSYSFNGPTNLGEKVNKHNCLPPFNFPDSVFLLSSLLKQPVKFIVSMYATHLYDSVVVYATALHHLIQQASATGEDTSIENLAKDGRRITQAILNSGGYQSVSGKFVPINKDGDSKGKFKIFRLKKTFFSYTSFISGENFTCRHSLIEEENYLNDFIISKDEGKTILVFVLIPIVFVIFIRLLAPGFISICAKVIYGYINSFQELLIIKTQVQLFSKFSAQMKASRNSSNFSEM